MDKKLKILLESMPKAMLRALTPEAVEAAPAVLIADDLIAIKKFPFRVGRESRVALINGRLERVERRKEDDSDPTNDLYLVDRGHRLNISREHFQIEKRDEGYFLVDRGSACGTKIEGDNVGGDVSGGAIALRDGDVIGVGASATPYIYKFICLDEYEVVSKQ